MVNTLLKNIKDVVIIALFVSFIVGIIYILFFGPLANYSQSLFPARTLVVSAEEKIIVQPDIAKISFSVVSRNVNPDIANSKNNQIIQRVIEYLISFGITKENLKTTQYNLVPVYSVGKERNYISEYEFTQQIMVQVRDLKMLGKIIGALPGLGVNRIEQIAFAIENPDKYLADARRKAFEKAQAKALDIAKINKIRLGRIVNISDSSSGHIPYYGGNKNVSTMFLRESQTASIEPGTQELSVNVVVTYEIK